MTFLEYVDEVGYPRILMDEVLKNKDKYVYYIRIKGKAQIAPKVELKILQKILKDYLQEYYYKSYTSENATAYIQGKNISYNVQKHQGNSYFFVSDFKNFFPSISKSCIQDTLNIILKEEENISLIYNIITHRDRLQYGFPTSPLMSNLVMKEFDDSLMSMLNEKFEPKYNIQYTRYSDDITISSKYLFIKKDVLEIIYNLLADKYCFMKLNVKKTRYFEKYSKRPYITGLVPLSNRLTIGKKKFNFIKSNIYTLLNKKTALNSEFYTSLESLSGYLSYIYLVDKNNYFRLKTSFKEKYSLKQEFKEIFKK